ncbi:MAG TPA: hypothetical protein VFS10_16795 [Pyrinomonadaceae bacterium]|nr:hypothetical protein [Pyrinomonadaceae bacterium]
MKRIVIICCCALLLSSAPSGFTQTRTPAPLPLNHGGKIESKYDGFARETVVALRKMKVTCGAGKGFEGTFKETCVSLAASLHCPGKQLDYVRHARLRLVFEAKDWDARHPLGARELVAVADGETLKLGTMRLVNQKVDSDTFDETMNEVLEVSVPHRTFDKIAKATFVEFSLGNSSFALRDKNVAALRDLNNRVRLSNK